MLNKSEYLDEASLAEAHAYTARVVAEVPPRTAVVAGPPRDRGHGFAVAGVKDVKLRSSLNLRYKGPTGDEARHKPRNRSLMASTTVPGIPAWEESQ